MSWNRVGLLVAMTCLVVASQSIKAHEALTSWAPFRITSGLPPTEPVSAYWGSPSGYGIGAAPKFKWGDCWRIVGMNHSPETSMPTVPLAKGSRELAAPLAPARNLWT